MPRGGPGEEPRRNHGVGPWVPVIPVKVGPSNAGGDISGKLAHLAPSLFHQLHRLGLELGRMYPSGPTIRFLLRHVVAPFLRPFYSAWVSTKPGQLQGTVRLLVDPSTPRSRVAKSIRSHLTDSSTRTKRPCAGNYRDLPRRSGSCVGRCLDLRCLSEPKSSRR